MHAPVEGPLARELRDIADGNRDFPETTARRHHYVPAFLLARFADPVGDRRGWMYQLDTSTGKPQKTTPNSACFERDLYSQTVGDGRDNTIEALFSIVEKHAASAIERLIADPLKLTAEDRETLSYFLAFQFSRTPASLEQRRAMADALMTALFGMHFADPPSNSPPPTARRSTPTRRSRRSRRYAPTNSAHLRRAASLSMTPNCRGYS